jgi:hypothetical protein
VGDASFFAFFWASCIVRISQVKLQTKSEDNCEWSVILSDFNYYQRR